MPATILTRQFVMKRAWDRMREHMRWNRFTRWDFARYLRQAWYEAKLRLEFNQPLVDSTEAERTFALVRNLKTEDPRAEAQAARAVEQERREMEEKRRLIESAKGRFARVVFIKKDGSIRRMTVQPAKLKLHVKGETASEAAQKGRGDPQGPSSHPHLMPVWDTEAQAPRSVNLNTITRISVNGKTHRYAA